MKPKTKILLIIKAVILLIIITAGVSPVPGASTVPPTVFSGEVIGTNLSHSFIEYYINHNEQRQTISIVEEGGKFTYSVTVPMDGVSTGSTITFKINEQIYGFGTLDGTVQKLDLQKDERG